MHDSRFAPHRHIPKFSFILLKSLKTPLLIYFTILGNAITFLSAYLFYHFENIINPNVESFWDALWWALCTVSTVGYGDVYPMTTAGRIVGAFLIVIGVTFFLSFMAVHVSVVSTLVSGELSEKSKNES